MALSILEVADEEEEASIPLKCGVCKWLRDQTPEHRAQWNVLLADRSRKNAALHRAMVRFGYPGAQPHPVSDHRTNNHAV